MFQNTPAVREKFYYIKMEYVFTLMNFLTGTELSTAKGQNDEYY